MTEKLQLEVKDVTIVFGGIKALDGVCLKVMASEVVGLVGPNGAGKTSLINVVNGLYRPEQGKVLFDGRDITGLTSEHIVKMGIARTFQQVELFRGMNVLENLLLGCSIFERANIFKSALYWGPGQKQEMAYRRQAEEVIDFMELEPYRKWPVESLPVGVAKLVGVARALCMKPKLLLLDEPSSGMNRDEKENFARFLLRIKYTLNISMLWVEHDMKLIGDIADRIVVLHYGKQIASGSIQDIAASPAVLEAYWGKT